MPASAQKRHSRGKRHIVQVSKANGTDIQSLGVHPCEWSFDPMGLSKQEVEKESEGQDLDRLGAREYR